MTGVVPTYLIQNGIGSACTQPQASLYDRFATQDDASREGFIAGMLYDPGVQVGVGTPVGSGAASSHTVVVVVGDLSMLSSV